MSLEEVKDEFVSKDPGAFVSKLKAECDSLKKQNDQLIVQIAEFKIYKVKLENRCDIYKELLEDFVERLTSK